MTKRALVLSDMTHCRPASGLVLKPTHKAWQILDYETAEGVPRRGRMIYAPSYTEVPEVSLPLGAAGWHHVYVGCWNPHHAHDGGMTLKVKVSSDACYTRISEPPPPIDTRTTCLREVFFRTADLTGEELRFAQVHGAHPKKACVAYVKLVPLAAREVVALTRERGRRDTRTMIASNDGISFFQANEYRTQAHVRELVEPYRHSDVGRLLWAVNYGDTTNYPSRRGTWIAGPASAQVFKAPRGNGYVKGVKAGLDSLRSFAARGTTPVQIAARHAHAMGIRCDAMFRLAILGRVPPAPFHPGRFVREQPHCRQVTREGVAVEKASYAFPAVREFMASLVAEAVGRFDVDGAVLGFVRGPEFMLYERPVLADYRREVRRRGGVAEQPRELLETRFTGRPLCPDGRLDKACWRRSRWLGSLRTAGGDAPRNATRFKLARDRDHVFVGIECAVRNPGDLKCACLPGARSSKAWQDDCIDLKLSADGGRTASQFIVSASGAAWARHVGRGETEGGWTAAVQIGSAAYTVELAIPLRVLGLRRVRPGTPLLINLGRMDRSAGVQASVLAEPYLELFRAPLALLGTESEFRSLPGSAGLARIDRADGRNAPFSDPAMQTVRCGYLTRFVRDVRARLDAIGARKGRRLGLGTWVYGDLEHNLGCGFDVEGWIKEGLIDSVIGYMGSNPDNDWRLVEFAKRHGCGYHAGFIPWQDFSARTGVAQAAAAYAAGADGVAVWDMDHAQDRPDWWAAGRQMGHRAAVRAFAERGCPAVTGIPLRSVAGCDVAQGLYAAVYSGG